MGIASGGSVALTREHLLENFLKKNGESRTSWICRSVAA